MKWINSLLISFCLGILFNNANATIHYRNQHSKHFQQLHRQAPNLNPHVLNLAIKAYQHARKQGLDKRGLITIIDYSLASNNKRLWVINLNQDKVLYRALVAHGKNSGERMAYRFSNSPGSLESSIGVFLTAGTYYGHRGFSLRLKGLEKGFNNFAMRRAIVMHGAWYVSQDVVRKIGEVGHSWGCPAVSQRMAKPIIKTIKNGTLLFAYYPSQRWLHHSSFLT